MSRTTDFGVYLTPRWYLHINPNTKRLNGPQNDLVSPSPFHVNISSRTLAASRLGDYVYKVKSQPPYPVNLSNYNRSFEGGRFLRVGLEALYNFSVTGIISPSCYI